MPLGGRLAKYAIKFDRIYNNCDRIYSGCLEILSERIAIIVLLKITINNKLRDPKAFPL